MFLQIFTASNNCATNKIISSFSFKEDLQNSNHSCYSFIIVWENICITLWNYSECG